MSRLSLIDPIESTGKAHDILSKVQEKLGRVPNMMRLMANSPAVLELYLKASEILASSSLDSKLRESIAITVAQANQCEYCLSAHSLHGGKAGVSVTDLQAARSSGSSDPKVAEALQFAALVIRNRGEVQDSDIDKLRYVGYSDGEIAEIIAVTTFNVFPNYFNRIVIPETDFPRVDVHSSL